MTWDARLATDYEPSFDIDRELGYQGELFIKRLLENLQTNAIEIKTDEKAVETGRIYIETECLGRSGWYPSGITASSADLYAYLLGQSVAVFIPTAVLRAMLPYGTPRECPRGSHPTKGVVIRLSDLLNSACRLGKEQGGQF